MTSHQPSAKRWLYWLVLAVCVTTFVVTPVIEIRDNRLATVGTGLVTHVLGVEFIGNALKNALMILIASALAPCFGLGIIAVLHRIRLSDIAVAVAVWSFSVGGLLALFWFWTGQPS